MSGRCHEDRLRRRLVPRAGFRPHHQDWLTQLCSRNPFLHALPVKLLQPHIHPAAALHAHSERVQMADWTAPLDVWLTECPASSHSLVLKASNIIYTICTTGCDRHVMILSPVQQ
jgi:hypothetical protein